MLKKWLSLALALCLCLSLLPAAIAAEEPATGEPAEIAAEGEETIPDLPDEGETEAAAEAYDDAELPEEAPETTVEDPVEDPAEDLAEDPVGDPAEDPAEETDDGSAEEKEPAEEMEEQESASDEPADTLPAEEPASDGDGEVVASGEDDSGSIQWTLDAEGVLRITEKAHAEEDEDGAQPASEVPGGLVPYEDRASVRVLEIGEGFAEIGDDAFASFDSLKEVRLPSTLRGIGEWAFTNCNALESIVLPEGLTEIGIYAFSGCQKLRDVTIPTTVERIESGAFRGCDGLTARYAGTEEQWYAIQIGSDNTALWNAVGYPLRASGTAGEGVTWTLEGSVLTFTGEGTLQQPDESYSDSVVTVVISEGITAIESYVFTWYEKLENVSLPKSLISIGENAFHMGSYPGAGSVAVTELKSVTYAGDADSWKSVTVGSGNAAIWKGLSYPVSASGTDGDLSWTIGDHVLTVTGSGAIKNSPWSEYGFDITTVVVGDGVTSLGSGVFRGMPRLESVTLPASIALASGTAFDAGFDTAKILYAGAAEYDSLILPDPQVGLVNFALPSAVVGEPYNAQLVVFSDEGYTRHVRGSGYYYPADGGDTGYFDGTDEPVELAPGLTLKPDGTITGTPTEAGRIWINYYVSWEETGTQYIWSVDGGFSLTVVGRDDPNCRTPDAAAPVMPFREEVTVPANTEGWYRFVAPNTDTVLEIRGDITMLDDSHAYVGGVYDQNGVPVYVNNWGGGVTEDSQEVERFDYRTTPGETYYVCLSAGPEGGSAKLLPYVQTAAAEGDTVIASHGSISLTETGVSKSFEGEENTLWDLWTYTSVLDAEFGLALYGWIYGLEPVNVITPYPVYFGEMKVTTPFGRVTDTSVSFEPAENTKALRVGEGETLYSAFYQDTIACPGIQANGRIIKQLEVYVPTGRTLVFADGAYRDESAVTLTDVETGLTIGGSVDSDMTLTVTPINAGGNFEVVRDNLKVEPEKLCMYDITLWKDGTEVQPDGRVRVSFPLPAGFDFKKSALYHVAEDGTLTQVPWTLEGANTVVFETDHFSVYVLAELSALRGDCNGDGKVNRQDRVYLARALAGWEGCPVPSETVADLNRDGKVNRQDRVYLARALAGWEEYSLD